MTSPAFVFPSRESVLPELGLSASGDDHGAELGRLDGLAMYVLKPAMRACTRILALA